MKKKSPQIFQGIHMNNQSYFKFMCGIFNNYGIKRI